MSTTGGGSSSRKFVTEELLTKLNTVLEQLSRQQPPINPSVDAYKQENDKVEHYLNELKKNPDDPYLRAQLHQAMDDRQHLYNLIQGNRNPFKLKPTLHKAHKLKLKSALAYKPQYHRHSRPALAHKPQYHRHGQ